MRSYEVRAAEPFRDQLAAAQIWWAGHREKNPNALDQDVASLLRRLGSTPWVGQQIEGYPTYIRTFLLRKTHHRVAFRIEEDEGVVQILAIWGTPEEKPRSF